ncbi:Signal recognition particle, SRP9 subunit [Penicillium expansum]|uniref:Signal recognition particle, SRP9 subunit n=1 Tax=Penicillium expansum TaxID=27334 RepID=A0A0A2IZP5_PENEN|nr:Signal recognition particle, SRP9 subunit [Penicillium expansum]KGO47655.1 Signal recognition particle, SRP9 subunit [Penicillium expansum]KGO47943.1 Signal recognition particle, SRP9 subunit [Penicillium expansum]KGO60488.1 Signal recognition particle, SRP9 subunit [Penicillium expansum]
MPYLPTSQAYLEQSAQLLQAYPDTTRIVTKYNFPTNRRGNLIRAHKSKVRRDAAKGADASSTTPAQPTTAIATLTLKTFNPTTGICLHYRTNKAQEVGRLITSLGKLAAGADVAGLGLSAAVPAAGADVEMVDAPAPAPVEEAAPVAGKAQGQSAKGKKKGGKGKR